MLSYGRNITNRIAGVGIEPTSQQYGGCEIAMTSLPRHAGFGLLVGNMAEAPERPDQQPACILSRFAPLGLGLLCILHRHRVDRLAVRAADVRRAVRLDVHPIAHAETRTTPAAENHAVHHRSLASAA